jgi:hypothetical protein
MEMVNRIADGIMNAAKKISNLNGVGLNGTPISELDVSLSFEEFTAFQNAQSRAFASGKLSMDEAQLIYSSLGGEMHHGGDGWPSDTSIATKLVITQACAELMGVKV